MNPLFRKALVKADDIRTQLGLDMFEPVNIIDACIDLGLVVRFVDVSMEGLYVKSETSKHSTILLSNQRPLPRRYYTCAHELGHHVFNHGFKIDGLSDRSSVGSNDWDELLVDSFAGALLMPVAGVQQEFAKRDCNLLYANPIDFYKVCSVFGIGYRTLITHCRVNGLIDEFKANNLLKSSPKLMFQTILGVALESNYFKIVDSHLSATTIDLEVSNYIILPDNIQLEGAHLERIQHTSLGTAYLARKAGISRAITSDDTQSIFIRIQNHRYFGLAEYRHLETN